MIFTYLIATIMLINYALKVLVEVAMTPVTYKVVGWLKNAENEGHYDRKTDINPFTLKA